MSDQSGRRLSFLICFVIYIVANIGLALQTNYAALLVLRIVQASGCSAAIALCNAVVADIATSAERGRYMGYATSGLLFGPAFGPTIGGLLAQYLGWRSIFWFLAIFSGILLALFALFFPETCRNVVGNGSIPARGINQSILGYLQQRRHANDADSTMDNASVAPKAKRKRTMPNPLTTLRILKEKESAIVLFYNGVFFCSMMMVTGSLPNLFKENYNLDELKVGLCFIAMGAGSLTAALTMGHVVDWNFRRHARRIGMVISKKQQDLRDFPIEVVRMQVVLPGHCIGTAALIAFGWTIKYRLHIAAPEVFLFFIGFGISTAFNQTNTLIIDMHRDKPATATCAINLIRCLMSAGGVAAIIPMIDAMNPGWAFTFIGLVYVLLISVIFLIMKHGQRWRKERLERRERQAARKEEMANAARMADAEVRSMDDKSSHHEKEGDMKTVT